MCFPNNFHHIPFHVNFLLIPHVCIHSFSFSFATFQLLLLRILRFEVYGVSRRVLSIWDDDGTKEKVENERKYKRVEILWRQTKKILVCFVVVKIDPRKGFKARGFQLRSKTNTVQRTTRFVVGQLPQILNLPMGCPALQPNLLFFLLFVFLFLLLFSRYICIRFLSRGFRSLRIIRSNDQTTRESIRPFVITRHRNSTGNNYKKVAKSITCRFLKPPKLYLDCHKYMNQFLLTQNVLTISSLSCLTFSAFIATKFGSIKNKNNSYLQFFSF